MEDEFDLFDIEMFNINLDPECLNNLALDSSYEEIKVKLWRELRATLEAQGDPRMFGKGDLFDTYEYVGDISHSWKAYTQGWWKPL